MKKEDRNKIKVTKAHEKSEIMHARKIVKHAQKIVDLHKGMMKKKGE